MKHTTLEIKLVSITELTVDCIVNAANSQLQHGGGVCGAIFAATGAGSCSGLATDTVTVPPVKRLSHPASVCRRSTLPTPWALSGRAVTTMRNSCCTAATRTP